MNLDQLELEIQSLSLSKTLQRECPPPPLCGGLIARRRFVTRLSFLSFFLDLLEYCIVRSNSLEKVGSLYPINIQVSSRTDPKDES